MASKIRLFCALLSADGKPMSRIFDVTLQSGATVADLRDDISAKKFKNSPNPTELHFWKPLSPLHPSDETLADALKDILVHDPSNIVARPGAQRLTAYDSITEEFYEDIGKNNLHIIARVPQGTDSFVGGLSKRPLIRHVRDLSIEFGHLGYLGSFYST
jgi:hypothetical protein